MKFVAGRGFSLVSKVEHTVVSNVVVLTSSSLGTSAILGRGVRPAHVGMQRPFPFAADASSVFFLSFALDSSPSVVRVRRCGGRGAPKRHMGAVRGPGLEKKLPFLDLT